MLDLRGDFGIALLPFGRRLGGLTSAEQL
jgi:hypothetical protein